MHIIWLLVNALQKPEVILDPYSDGPEPSYNLELPFPREDPGGKRKPFFKTVVGKGSEVKLRKSWACNLAYGFCESPP